MKILFVDFDGVLNCEKYVRAQNVFGVIIDPSKMKLLKEIVQKTDARIVLSTSWREHWEKDPDACDDTGRKITEIFDAFGIPIYDKTPKLGAREQEIKAWLDRNVQTKSFAVLDDAFLSADFLEGHFVKTSDYFGGLDNGDVKKAIEILKRG